MRLIKTSNDNWVFHDPAITYDIEQEFDRATDEWRSGNIEIAETIFRDILQKCPTHIDAIHHYSNMLEDLGNFIHAFNY